MNKKTYYFTIIFTVALSFLPTLVMAGWIEIDPSESRSFSFFFDPVSVKKQGNIALIKTLKNFKEPQNSVDPKMPYTFFSNTSVQEIDCAKNKYRLKEISMWSKEFGEGKLEQAHIYGSSTSWGKWVKTTSIESIVIGKACRGD
jgi:hypothetical protein